MWDDVIEEDKPAGGAPPAEPASEQAAEQTAEGTPGEQPSVEVAEPPPSENLVHGTEPKRLVCKHWVRPKFFQYNYIYDYQKNYYDDLINYMDRRNNGLPVERPVPQTWGERALRTYLSKGYTYSTKKYSKDTTLLHHISVGAKFQRAHTKSLISRKYSKLGINSVYI